MYGPGSSVKNTNARVWDQNLYGSKPSVSNFNKGSDLRSLAISGGRNEIIVNSSGSTLPMLSNEVSFWGENNGQNLHGHRSPRSNFNPNYGGFSLYPRDLQAASRPRDESKSIDFSQSLTQILTSLGHNLNTNSKEGFNVISACTDTWKKSMTVWHNKQEERIHGLEHQLSLMNNAFQRISAFFPEDFRRLDEMVSWHVVIIPRIRQEVGTSLRKVNTVLEEVERKMEEFQERVNYVKPTDMTTEIPMEIVNSLNEIILDRSPATTMESVCQQVNQLEGAVQVDQQTTDHVRSAMVELEEKISNPSFNTSEVRDYLPQSEIINSD